MISTSAKVSYGSLIGCILAFGVSHYLILVAGSISMILTFGSLLATPFILVAMLVITIRSKLSDPVFFIGLAVLLVAFFAISDMEKTDAAYQLYFWRYSEGLNENIQADMIPEMVALGDSLSIDQYPKLRTLGINQVRVIDSTVALNVHTWDYFTEYELVYLTPDRVKSFETKLMNWDFGPYPKFGHLGDNWYYYMLFWD